jgi:hypothetical protein
MLPRIGHLCEAESHSGTLKLFDGFMKEDCGLDTILLLSAIRFEDGDERHFFIVSRDHDFSVVS